MSMQNRGLFDPLRSSLSRCAALDAQRVYICRACPMRSNQDSCMFSLLDWTICNSRCYVWHMGLSAVTFQTSCQKEASACNVRHIGGVRRSSGPT